MLKNKKMMIITASILTLAIGTTGIFAWFANKAKATQVTVGAANLNFCFNQQLIGIDGVMPGDLEYIEKAYVEEGKYLYISNGGQGDLFAQITYDIDVFLPKGVKPPQEFENDYIYVDSQDQYKFTKERVAKVAYTVIEDYENMPDNNIYKIIGDRHYVYLVEDGQIGNGAGSTTEGVYPLQLKVTGELGGTSRDPVTGKITPSRQFEQKSIIKVTPASKAMQNNRNLCIEAFGAEDISKLPPEWFVD